MERGSGSGSETKVGQQVARPSWARPGCLTPSAAIAPLRTHASTGELRFCEADGLPHPEVSPVAHSQPANDTAASPLHDTANVLVVDDDPMVRRVLVAMLARLGLTAVSVDGGAEAIALVRAGHAFSAVILDLTMPGLSGADTFRALRELAPGLPVVICSGYAPAGSLDDDMRREVAGMIRKPFAPDELRRAIENAGILPAQG